MADIDVSEILNDPDFADAVSVIRRSQTVDEHGRAVNSSKVIEGVMMNISPTGRNDVERLDDSQKNLRSIKVVTQFRLQGPTIGMNADLVSWQGSMYIVAVLDPYTHFGGGFVEGILVSTNIQEVPFA